MLSLILGPNPFCLPPLLRKEVRRRVAGRWDRFTADRQTIEILVVLYSKCGMWRCASEDGEAIMHGKVQSRVCPTRRAGILARR